MLRTFQSIAVTLFFGGMMVLLFRDHVIPNWNRGGGIDVDRSILTDGWVNQDEWNVISLDSVALGGIRTTAEYVEEGNFYLMGAHLEVRTAFLRARVLSAARLNHRLELEAARVLMHFPQTGEKLLGPEELDGEVLPRGAIELNALIEGQVLRYRVRREDALRHNWLRLARPVTMSDSILPVLRGRMLTRGVTYAIDVYDPLWGNNSGKMEIEYLRDRYERIDGDSVQIRTVELRLGGMRTLLEVDENGNVLRREIPLFPSAAQQGDLSRSSMSFVMERLDRPTMVPTYPELVYMQEAPELSREDVTGQDRGDLGGRFSLFSLFGNAVQDQFRRQR